MKLNNKNDKVQKYINVLRHKEYTKDYISWLQYIHVLHVIDIDGLCKRELNRATKKKNEVLELTITTAAATKKKDEIIIKRNSRNFTNPKHKKKLPMSKKCIWINSSVFQFLR